MTLTRVYDYDEIPEGVNAGDTPLLMVYCQSVLADPTGETDRGTFQTDNASIKVKEMIFHCDFFTSQRAHSMEDVGDQIDTMSAAIDVIEGQNEYPYWGNDAIKATAGWRMDRVQFDFAGAIYPGFRVELTVWVY
jgi:hypothetical protein